MVRAFVRRAVLAAAALGAGSTLVLAAEAQAGREELLEGEVDVIMPGGLTVLDEVGVIGSRRVEIQQATTQVVSVLSSEDIARTGEGDIAGALARVPGLTVVGGGFVYVRGLGDRYSLALLNGSPLPSPEPLRRAVPLNLFPTDVIASSLVQKTYSPNFPGEFGGGVINLTTLAIPGEAFFKLGAGIAANTGTTSGLGYDHYGSKYDWTGYDGGARAVPSALAAFYASGESINSTAVDSGGIAKHFVSWRNAAVQKVGDLPPDYSVSATGGNVWSFDSGSQLGLIATAGFSNGWRTRDSIEQTPGNALMTAVDKDYRDVTTENHVVTNALLGIGYRFGADHSLRWTNLYVHDTLKRTSLAEGRWNLTYADELDIREQETGWYERELLSTQIAAGFNLDPLKLDLRASYSTSERDAPYELSLGYSRSNNPLDPYGEHYVNRLGGQGGQHASIAFSDLSEDLISAGADLSWRVVPGVVLSAGYDYGYTSRDSHRREFLFRPSGDFPAYIGMLRPDYLLGSDVIDYYGIILNETTASEPAFAARMLLHGAYAQAQVQFVPGLELAIGARFERGKQVVRPIAVFNNQVLRAGERNEKEHFLPAATLTWKFGANQQLRFNASQTVARPQFRELMYQRYYDPEANRQYLGNPLLGDSRFLNAEARYELYFATEQRFSVAGFYKKIDDPIEAFSDYPQGNTPVTSFANAPEAVLYGAELEVQKYFPLNGLGGGSYGPRRFVAIGNYTYTTSEINVRANDVIQLYPHSLTRTVFANERFEDGSKMTGQSDHVLNLQFGLERTDSLSQQTFMLNYASDRVTSRIGGDFPNIVESPGLTVDFVARQGLSLFGQGVELKLQARNIFGREYKEFQERDGNRVYYSRYERGRSYSASVSFSF